MKINKEVLNKHRFWLLLSTFAFLWMLVFLMMMSGCVSHYEAKQKEYNAVKDTIPLYVPGKPAVNMATDKTREADRKKDQVWSVASKTQGPEIDWPPALRASPDWKDKLKDDSNWGYWLTGTGNADDDNRLRSAFQNTFYPKQFEPKSWFKLTDRSLEALTVAEVPSAVVLKLRPLKDKVFDTREQMSNEVATLLTKEELESCQQLLLTQAEQKAPNPWVELIAPAYFGEETRDAKGPRNPESAWKHVMRLQEKLKEIPSKEECVILQEDFRIRVLLLEALKVARDSAGRFESLGKFKQIDTPAPEPQPPPAPAASNQPSPAGAAAAGQATPPPPPAPAPLRFRNADWELTLNVKFADGKLAFSDEGTIRNINKGITEKPETLAGLKLNFRQPLIGFRLDDRSLELLKVAVPDKILKRLAPLKKGQMYSTREQLSEELRKLLPKDELEGFQELVLDHALIGDDEVRIEQLPLPGDAMEQGKTVSIKPALAVKGFDPQRPIEVEQDYFPALPGCERRLRVANSNWELDLHLRRNAEKGLQIDDKKSTIKNINAGMHPLDLSLVRVRLQQKDATPVEFTLLGEALAWNKSGPIKVKEPMVLATFEPRAPVVVEQLFFAWANAPIRRIDQIEVGNERALDHSKYLEPTLHAKPASGAAPPPPAPTPGPGQGAGAGVDKDKQKLEEPAGPNKLKYRRYVSAPTEQFRRLPVAIKLVVDPAHVQEVKTALANSPLRFGITQPAMRHPRSVPFTDPQGQKKDEDPNLMELTIVGEVTLYEKYHPKVAVGERPGLPK